jgi:hypothetical protein
VQLVLELLVSSDDESEEITNVVSLKANSDVESSASQLCIAQKRSNTTELK